MGTASITAIKQWGLAALIIVAAAPSTAHAEDKGASSFRARQYASAQGGTLPYGLFVPRNLDPSKRYPLVLFLHGAGERGTDNQRQLRDIAAWTEASVQAKHPCFIVAPQCPNWREGFQVYGSNSELVNTTYKTYAGSEKQWKHYVISPGRQSTGKMSWLFFVNDDWGKDTPVESYFRGVKVYEAGQAARAKAVDFRKAPLTAYGGGGRGNNPTVEDDGATLHMVGDSRKKIPLPYTLTKNTVLEFDFKSGARGNLHAIGFDDNDLIEECKWVQVDWGAAEHSMPKEPSFPMRMVTELLPTLQKEFPAIDAKRLYIAGLSMGGFGVWDLLARRPDWFAAGVPICGGADLETVNTVAPIPIWDFHGSQDGTVRVDRSRNMIAAIWNVGGEPRYTEYPGVGHDSWTKALAEPELIEWLFAQKRPAGPPPPPTNLKATCVGVSKVELTWTPSTGDESGIKEYRVLRDGGEIGFALEPRFTDQEIAAGEVHSYTVIAMNRAWLKSTPTPQVWAKTPADTLPVRIESVESQGNPYRVEIHFDKAVDPKQANEAGNYAIDHDVAVNSALVLPDEKTVRLETSAQAPGTEYTLTVNNLTDRAAKPHTIAANTRAKFTYDPCLAAHWRLDEGDGAYGADATGNGPGSNGNVLTFHSVDWTPGKWGKALNFDGSGSHYAWTMQSRSLDLIDGLTVSLWVKKGAGQYGHQVFIAKSNYYDRRTQFMIDMDPSQRIRATVGTLDKGEIVVTGRRIDAREWHHIALTFGANTLQLYIDGELQGKAAGGDKLMSVSEAITVGAGHQGRDPVRATIDEIRIYNKALTPEQVRALATADTE